MADYDTSSIKIDPHQVSAHADTLKNLGAEVLSLIEQVQNVTNKLTLGWAGQTSEEADRFNKKWRAVMVELFGTEDKNDKDPSHAGVLNVMAGGLNSVAHAFSDVENALGKAFESLSGGMQPQPDTDPGKSKIPGSAPSNIDDPTKSVVIEKWK